MTGTKPAIMSRDIPLDRIDPDPAQPRKHFDTAALDELARSMAANGLAVPVLVRPQGDRYVLVHGERRWRAATKLDWSTIPATVRDLSPDEAHWLSLVENVQRRDLSPLEEARAYQAILAGGTTQAVLGARIGKTQSYVAQKLRLLTLPAPIACYLERGALSEGHVRLLLKIRSLYGPDADRELSLVPPAVDFADRVAVFELFRNIRPEDNPPGWIALGASEPVSPELTAGCAAFERWVASAGGLVPCWAVAAFWWASLAVAQSVSVADLATLLNGWQDRFLSAVAWGMYFGSGLPQRPPTDSISIEAWGYWSDLRHAGALAHLPKLSERLGDDAIAIMTSSAGYALPSSVQPWGFQHERYATIRAKEERAA